MAEKNDKPILRDLEPSQVLSDHCQQDVIDDNLRDEIRAERTRKKQAEVVHSLTRRGTDAIERFTVGLRKSFEEKLAEMQRELLAYESSGVMESVQDSVGHNLQESNKPILQDLNPGGMLNHLHQEADLQHGIEVERSKKMQAKVLADSFARKAEDAMQQLTVGLQKYSQDYFIEMRQRLLANESSGVMESMQDSVGHNLQESNKPILQDLNPGGMLNHLQDAMQQSNVGSQKYSQENYREMQQRLLANENSGMVQSMHDSVDRYSMDRNPCGLAFIIDNYRFDEGTHLEHREGALEDVEKMNRLFARLRFTVIRKSNLTCAKIKEVIRRLMLEDHTQYNCFVLFIMSHGNKDGIYGTDGKVVRIQEDITMKFNPKLCPTLANKPKLFFFQASRGPSPDMGVTMMEGPRVGTSQPFEDLHRNLPRSKPETEDTETTFQTMVPHDSDIFIGFPSSPTRAPLRNTKTGSWFVNELYEVMWKYADKEDLLTMMTMVNGRVTRKKTDRDNYMQCPEQHNRLGKKLYFRPRPVEEFS